MATQQLKISRAQLAAFLKDPVSIKQFEQMFNMASDITVTGGGVTYDDIPVVSPATITATLTRIAAQLEAIATAYPGADKAWAKKELAVVLTRLEALETEYPGNDKAWVKAQKFMQSTVYTVATLPAGFVGMRAFVSNALGPAFGAAVVGGGAVQVPVYYDGAWKVG